MAVPTTSRPGPGPTSARAAVRAAEAKAAAKARAAAKAAAAAKVPPSLREEKRLLREGGHRWLVAIDEVGRGALAGPVSVGVVVVDVDTRSAPAGVRDSKLLTPAARRALVPRLKRWAPMHAVGHASPDDIDRIGIVAALRLAACRAFVTLPVQPDLALLDGNHNWLHDRYRSLPAVYTGPALFDLEDVAVPGPDPDWVPPLVVTRIKADMRCAAVAAASVLAKVERDGLMVGLAEQHPEYGWHENKGYSAPEHIEALRRWGATVLHRRSWALPGGVPVGGHGAGDGQITIEELVGEVGGVIDVDAVPDQETW